MLGVNWDQERSKVRTIRDAVIDKTIEKISSQSICSVSELEGQRLAVDYLKGSIESTADITAALGALAWLYPEAPVIELALAKASLFVNDPWRALRHLFRVIDNHSLETWIIDALRTAGQTWSSLQGWSQLKSFLRRRLISMGWGEGVMSIEREQCMNLPDRLALTEFEIRGADRKDVKVIVSLDRIEDFVRNQWGNFGISVLRAFRNLIIGIRDQPQSEIIQRITGPSPFTSFTLLATSSGITVAAICSEEKWQEFLEFLFWINDVTGQPNASGLFGHGHLRTSVASPLNVLFKSACREMDNSMHSLDMPGSTMLPLEAFIVQHDSHREKVTIHKSPFDLCWTVLVDSAYSGRYTLQLPTGIDTTRYGIGLRVDFKLLMAMAGTASCIIYDGGVIFAGFRFALVPIKFLDKGRKSVQWHLLENKD